MEDRERPDFQQYVPKKVSKAYVFKIFLYTIVLVATSMLPFIVHMSGLIYLVSASVLGLIFLWYAWRIYQHYTDLIARKAFTYSIIYLSLLFAALLVDHYLPL